MKDTWRQFAHKLFDMEEADPMYYVLARAGLDVDTMKRFVVAWITYYNPGVAASCAKYEGAAFWDCLTGYWGKAARGSERRHFRTQGAANALHAWRVRFQQPEHLIDAAMGDHVAEVARHCKDIPQLGSYFVWKLADVQERVFRVHCSFDAAYKFWPSVPVQGSHMIAIAEGLPGNTGLDVVTHMILDELRRHRSPPWYDRPLNMQEAETVCCVYHQYIGGGYVYGRRTAKAFKSLLLPACFGSGEPVACAMFDAIAMGLHQPREWTALLEK